MFDFDKSAAMSTFAIGQGIASPVTTATSIATSLVGAGIGNKVAGEKGALVGGFVGGLLGDRTLNAVRHAKNTNKNIGVVSEYYKNPDNPLLSEVDWRGWSKGGEISKEHLAEYAAIERAAKANDTWLKTRDGEPWKGDKRTWIQLMSKDGEKFRHGEFPSNRDIWYNGVPDDGTMLRDYPTYTGDTWLADRYEAALPYSKTMKGQVFHIGAGGDGKNYVIIVYDDGTVKGRSIVGPVSSISTGPYDYCCVGVSYQGGARIYTFLATSVPDSLTYYTPGMFTPSAVIQGFHSTPRSVVYSTISNYTYVSTNPTGTQWTAATTRPQLTALTKGLYANEAGTNTFMLIGNNMKSVSTDRGNNWTTSTLGEYTLTDLIYVDSNWYAIGSNGTKRLLLQNTASTFDQSNKILDLPDYSRQVIKINT